jgi:hypothetical protein
LKSVLQLPARNGTRQADYHVYGVQKAHEVLVLVLPVLSVSLTCHLNYRSLPILNLARLSRICYKRCKMRERPNLLGSLALRGFQMLFAIVVLGLSVTSVKDQKHGWAGIEHAPLPPTTLSLATGVGALSLVAAVFKFDYRMNELVTRLHRDAGGCVRRCSKRILWSLQYLTHTVRDEAANESVGHSDQALG